MNIESNKTNSKKDELKQRIEKLEVALLFLLNHLREEKKVSESGHMKIIPDSALDTIEKIITS